MCRPRPKFSSRLIRLSYAPNPLHELTAALVSLTAPGAVVIDDADLPADCQAGRGLSKIITRGTGHPLALVLASDPESLASGFGGWQAGARRARRGCLTAPQTLPEGELIGARLTHAHIGHPPRPAVSCSTPGTAASSLSSSRRNYPRQVGVDRGARALGARQICR